MGSLKPGVTYIYEKADGITYRREPGSLYREEVGRDYAIILRDELLLWEDIVRASKSQPALRKALDNAIMIYRLSKDNPK